MWKMIVGVLMVLALTACNGDEDREQAKERFGEQFPVIPASAGAEAYQPGTHPMITLQVYMTALENRMKSPNLPIFTPESQTFLADRTPTDAQQEKTLNDLKKRISSAVIQVKMPLAVVRFPVAESRRVPILLKAGETGWEIDLVRMEELMDVDGEGRWRFTSLDHEFMFAFPRERFDEQGVLGR